MKAWGQMGSGRATPEPHDLFVGGSRGYVYVADRQNNRIQVSIRTVYSSPHGLSSGSRARSLSTRATTFM